MSSERPRGPWEMLGSIGRQQAQINPTTAHIEIYTMQGLLTLVWHGDPTAEAVAVCCGGAMGGLLGPGRALYHHLGDRLAARGAGLIRVSYRQPNNIDLCVLDVLAAADLACRQGTQHVVTVGHSFGGAVAVQAGIAMGGWTAGVVTMATQSAGCESAAQLAGVPMLLLHGDRDEILPPFASQVVHELAGGHGELEILPGVGHAMTEAADHLLERLVEWIPARFDEHAAPRG